MTARILIGHVLDRLAELPAESVHCCVTSPPYLGLRDYGIEPRVWGGGEGCEHEWGDTITRAALSGGDNEWSKSRYLRADGAASTVPASKSAFCRRCNAWRGSLGLEPTPALYIEHMVAVFRAVRRVLRKDGTLWLNIGDSYAAGGSGWRPGNPAKNHGNSNRDGVSAPGFKPKDLIGVPWALAFALRDDGWWLRSEITWAKRAPMPESVTDRPTCATEKVFLLTKSAKYFYDAEAVKEESEWPDHNRFGNKNAAARLVSKLTGNMASGTPSEADRGGKRNMRNFWLLGPEPFPEAHFATFPTEIPRRAINAGTSERGVCPQCGAPWERVVEVKADDRKAYATVGAGDKARLSRGDGNGLNKVLREDGRGGDLATLHRETIGWRPTCGCDMHPAAPATVLDPFLGSGTTALVADRLGSDCIGIELSEAYAEMARRRIADDAGIFAEVAAE